MRCLTLWTVALAAAPLVAHAAHPFGDDQIEVTVGTPFTICTSPGNYNFPTLKQLSGKELFVAIWASPDAALQEKDVHVAAAWTKDGGATWQEPAPYQGGESGGHSWARLRDGTCLWLSYFTRAADPRTVSCNVGRSKDGKTYSWSAGRASFPEPVKPWDQGNAYMVFARSILEMPDGSLLATMYGQFDGQRRDRSVLVRSTDRGSTWDYVSTVAYDPRVGNLDEPVMERLANGDLLCVMRNDGRPMLTTRSTDDGRTWGSPQRLADYTAGVFPDMVLMKSGILAVSFGRPGLHVMFSVDGRGLRWTSRTTLPLTGSSDCYTGIREVAPGRLLYVYHEVITAPDGKQENAIHGVFIDVRSKQGDKP